MKISYMKIIKSFYEIVLYSKVYVIHKLIKIIANELLKSNKLFT